MCDHHTFVFCSDGDLKEGISHEAASLAGHLGLGRLSTSTTTTTSRSTAPPSCLTDDVVERFAGYGWHVDELGETANDLDGLDAALGGRRPTTSPRRYRPAQPHRLAGPEHDRHEEAHGEPLGEDEVRATKEILGLPPEELLGARRRARPTGPRTPGPRDSEAWEKRLAAWDGDREAYEACQARRGLPGWEEAAVVGARREGRDPQGQRRLPRGAGDECPGSGRRRRPHRQHRHGDQGHGVARPTTRGRQIYFGVREHAMGGVMNGMVAHGGVVPVGGTFFIFTDYMRPAVRLAAMTEYKEIFVWTHDSVGLGEDGPTHQPIEHLRAARHARLA